MDAALNLSWKEAVRQDPEENIQCVVLGLCWDYVRMIGRIFDALSSYVWINGKQNALVLRKEALKWELGVEMPIFIFIIYF